MNVVPPSPPPTAVKPAPAVFPLLTLVVTLGVGAFVFSYGATHYQRLPEQVPIHFGGSGKPDAWAPRSFSSVMLLPVTTLFMGPFMALIAYLIANAQQAIRIGDGGASIVAQERFRAVMSTFLSGVSLLVTGMLALLSHGAIQIGLGQADRLPTAFLFFAVAMGVYVLVGVVVILVKYSRTPNQGLAINQSGQASLADNRNWKYGLFYVNRDDPSIFVERRLAKPIAATSCIGANRDLQRFGLGYTINFGNWKAVLGLAVFLAGIAAILIMSLFATG